MTHALSFISKKINYIILFLLFFKLGFTQLTTQTYNYVGSIQNFTVPNCVSTLTMEAWGAQGGNIAPSWTGGYGAYMSGVFTVTPGQVLKILVGGQAPSFTACGFAGNAETGGATGGGGGSFIATITNTPLLVAGGGGGRRCLGSGGMPNAFGSIPNTQAVVTTTAQSSQNTSGAPGTNGSGGQSGEPTGGGTGGPGGGFYTNGGASGTLGGTPGYAFINGGLFAPTCSPFSSSQSTGGGFGGGGAGCWCFRGTPGGGGGYSGGASGVNDYGGGGGASYNSGANQSNTGGVRIGNGQIILTYSIGLSPITISLSSSNICIGTSASITANGLSSYTWSTGSNSNSLVVTPAASANYTVTGTNLLGCVSSSVVSISVDGTPPSLSVLSPSIPICPGSPATLSAFGAVTYTWSGGLTNAIPFFPVSSGNYTVLGSNGCGTSSAVTSVSLYAAPNLTASVNTPTVCSGNAAILNASGALTYTWSGGQINGLAFTPLSTSAYTVTGTGAFGCTASAVAMLTVVPFSGSSISAVSSSSSICLGTTLTITASGANTYTWNTGSNALSLSLSPTGNTNYSVSGTNAQSCISSTVIAIHVDPALPSLSLSTSASAICPGKTVSLNASGASTYTWTNGVINGQGFVPLVSSSYTVIAANACGTASAVTSVSIHPTPPVLASPASLSVCSGNSVTLTGSGAATYTWSGGVVNGVAFMPLSSNTYTLIGESVLGCTASAVSNLSLVNTPTLAPVASSSLICIGSTASLTATGASNYTWMPGNLNTAAIIVNPASSTTYTLTQTTSNCSNTQTIGLYVNALPTPMAIASPTLICALQSSTLTAGGGNSYTWSPANLFGTVVNVSPSVTTLYTLTASDGTCVNTTTILLSVNPNPTLSISATNSVICEGESSTLTVSGANSYSWTPSVFSGTSAVVSPSTSSVYLISGQNAFGCSNAISQVIVVNGNPLLYISYSKTLACAGESVALNASGASTYTWINGSQTAGTVIFPSSTSIYTVTGAYVTTSCKSSKTVTISVYTPSINVPASAIICPGGSTILTASGALTYTWNGNTPFQSITVSPTINTVYTVAATSFSNGASCVSTNTILVSIGPSPTLAISANKIALCKGEKLILIGQGASTYLWNGAVNGTTFQVTPGLGQTTYTMQGTDPNGCVNTETIQVKVSNCTGIAAFLNSDTQIKIFPNPNTGEFTIQASIPLQLKLVNEFGQVIRHVKLDESTHYECKIYGLAKGLYFIQDENKLMLNAVKIVVDQ